MSLKDKAIEIAKAVRTTLGGDFLPGNIDEGGGDHDDKKRQWKLQRVRQKAGGGLSGLDKPNMFAMIARMDTLVRKYKQGACAELAALAYMEATTRAPEVPAQIVAIPHRKASDNSHAFVLLGVEKRLSSPTNLPVAIGMGGDAIIIDPWLKYRLSTPLSKVKGWFYLDEHSDMFDPKDPHSPQYDPTKATTLYPPA